MSETKEDIENGNSKAVINAESQARLNGEPESCIKDPESKNVPENSKAGSKKEKEEEEEKEENGEEGQEADENQCMNSSTNPPEDNDAGKRSRRQHLTLDIPCAQQQIPVLTVIPATGSIGHRSPGCGGHEGSSNSSPNSSPNSCVQCLITAKLVWTLLSTALDQITDAMAIERFYRMGHMLFFVLSLIFYIIPILCMCTYATKILKKKFQWTWLDCVLNFIIAPYWLIFVNITNSLKNGRNLPRFEENAIERPNVDDDLKDEKAMSTLHSLEGTLEAIPQVYIQIAAYMTLPVTNMYDEVVARLPLTMSVISAAWSMVATLDVGTSNVFWGGVHRFFAASEVGVAMTTRAMVAGGLYFQLYPGIWQWVWLLPILFSILITWFIVFFSVRSFKHLLLPFKKALGLPPADLESLCGLMPFLVAALCLLPATYEPLLYFVGFEFLAGLSWFCFTLPKEGSMVLK